MKTRKRTGEPSAEPLFVRGAYGPRVHLCGSWKSTQKPVEGPHWHGEYHILAVTAGTLTIQTPEWKYDFGPGEAAFVGPSHHLVLKLTIRSSIHHLAFSVMHGPLRGKIGSNIRPVSGSPPQPLPMEVWGVDPQIRMSPRMAQRSQETLALIRGEYWRTPGNYLRSCARLSILLADIVNEASTTTQPTTPVLLDTPICRSIGKLLAEIGHPLPRIDTLAKHLGMTREHLSRSFKAETERSLGAFLNNERWRHAISWLLEQDLSITEVVRLTGFGSPATFTVAFRHRFGCSPSAWRKRQFHQIY